MTAASEEADSFLPQSRVNQLTGSCSLAVGLGTIVVLSLATIAAFAADATPPTTIRDADNFSISINAASARVCIMFPQSARDPAACAGLIFPAQPPTNPERRDLAIGLIRFVDRGAPAKASLGVMFIPDSDSVEPDKEKAEAFARDFQRVYLRKHTETNIRPGTSHVELRVIEGLKVARVAYDVDALNKDEHPLTEHQIFYFVWAEGGVYMFMLTTGGDHAAAADAIADNSALTLKVLHPARPSLLSPELRPVVAVFVWFIFALFTMIDLLWAFLRKPRFAPPTSLATLPAATSLPSVKELDVSTPARLRKPIRSAARAFKLIGLLSSFQVAGYLDNYLGSATALVSSVVVLWGAFRVSKRLRSGSLLCAEIACVWCMVWVGVEVFDYLPKALKGGHDFYSVFYTAIGVSVSAIPLGFLVRGLLAFRALRTYQKSARNLGDPLANHPWEGGLYIRKHPRIVNKRSVSSRIFILLAPVPYLWVWATSNVTDNGDVAFALGQSIGATCLALGALVWGTHIYRRARKEAMLPGSELVKKDTRPSVLYLRSFHDDSSIKLRARATDGRILLERLVKISFEELVTDHLWGFGPVLAIGNPGTKGKPAPLGAARDYVTDAAWQETARNLMRQASMVVAIAAATQGLAWEIAAVVEQGFTAKLALLLPPLKSAELNARWEFLLNGALGSSLPKQVDFSRARAVVFPGGHPILITGNKRDAWTYEAVLDEAALVIAGQLGPSQVGAPRGPQN